IYGLKANVDASGQAEVHLRELERQAEANRSLYESFLAKYKRDVGQERIQRANARVLSSASIPAQPSLPRRMRIFMLSLILSIAGGLGLAFLLDRLNGRIRSVEEAEQLTGLPVLSVIPLQKNRDEALDARSAMADAFRSLRAVLAAQAGPQGAKVVLITSSVPREGKSFIARHFAFVCAATGQRVLVVDADLMRPQQHLALGTEPADGLTQLLVDPALNPLSKVLPYAKGGFDILPAGKVDAVSGHTLASGRIERILAALAPHYDRIVVDAPPSLAATDAQSLACVADQVVYVVKWNDTRRDAVASGIPCLQKVGANVTGIVLSQAKESWEAATAYGGYGYFGSYGKYYRQ
ncbi:MAG TPA: GNVR domain-containing protein, partial [Magnetospirillum sp.]|nr:GNVR domain-containing protein [Magnetospirillum sp.]